MYFISKPILDGSTCDILYIAFNLGYNNETGFLNTTFKYCQGL